MYILLKGTLRLPKRYFLGYLIPKFYFTFLYINFSFKVSFEKIPENDISPVLFITSLTFLYTHFLSKCPTTKQHKFFIKPKLVSYMFFHLFYRFLLQLLYSVLTLKVSRVTFTEPLIIVHPFHIPLSNSSQLISSLPSFLLVRQDHY